MKTHRIPLYTKVKVNDKAKKFMGDDVNCTGIVVEHLTNRLYDYLVRFDDELNNEGKFKEIELDVLEYPNGSDTY